MVEAIKIQRIISHLHITTIAITETEAKILRDLLQESGSCLKHLSLKEIKVSDKVIQTICEGVVGSNSLKNLYLDKVDLTRDMASSISKMILQAQELTSLSLCGDEIDQEKLDIILEFIPQSKLSEIHLENNNLNVYSAENLYEKFKYHEHLRKLSIKQNYLG